jgi:hypothetical protein
MFFIVQTFNFVFVDYIPLLLVNHCYLLTTAKNTGSGSINQALKGVHSNPQEVGIDRLIPAIGPEKQ